MEKMTLTLTKKEALEISALHTKYSKAIDILYNDDEFSKKVNAFTVKWLMDDGRTLIADFSTTNYLINVSCDCEIPTLLMNPKPFNKFNIVLDANSKDLKAVKTTYDPIARAFLDTEDDVGRTNLNMLLVLYFSGCIMFDILWMLTKRNGNEFRPLPNITKVAMEYINGRLLVIRNKQLIDGWDTISLTEKQIDKISSIFEKNEINLDFFHYAIEKFCFINFDGKAQHYYFYTLKSGELECEYKTPTSHKTIPFSVTFAPRPTEDGTIDLDMTLNNKEEDTEILTRKCKDSDKSYWEWMIGMFFVINTFMLNYGDVSLDVEEKEAIAPSNKKHNKKQERTSSRLFKSYTLKKRWASAVARKHAEITCPCWGVRGHFRHYRNGKVVFIEPFVKGKEKDKYKGKEYALLPYKDA